MNVRWQNPIISQYLADPMMFREGDEYYLFATGKGEDGRYIPIYRSENLRDWKFVRGAVAAGDNPQSWNRRNFWAPEVYKIDGRYFLYYTAMPQHTPANTGNRVGLAIAHSIEGPYEDVGPVIPHGSIDGHLYQHTDGTFYLYFTVEHGNDRGLTAGRLCVIPLTDLTHADADPVEIITHHRWQEGPFMLRQNDQLLLTYSVGNWTDDTYHLRYARGTSPAGKFVEADNIILASTADVKGPGHHTFFTGPDQKIWTCYHGWDTKFTARYPRIDPLIIAGDHLSSNGPSSIPMSL